MSMSDDSSDMDSDSSITSSGSSKTSTRESPEITIESYQTPGPSTKKKVVRRTNAQIQLDNMKKMSEKSAKMEAKKVPKPTTSSVAKSEIKTDIKIDSTPSTIEINGVTFPVQLARSNWSVAEQLALITAYKSWDDSTKNSQCKKLMPISKIWLIHIPALMGNSFGRVRVTPNNLLANSPYQSKWLAIRKKVSDFKAAQVDGREEELPDREGPTGGGLDENGIEDERSVKAAIADASRDSKRDNRYVTTGIDDETMKIINHFIELFPESVSGIGLMSESESTSGVGRKRESCEIEGLRDTLESEDVEGPPAKKVSKSSLIIDLTRTAVQQHEENMAFNKSAFEYQKTTRMEDIARKEEKYVREVEYRDKQDKIEHEKYVTEQRRLSETRQDNKEMQTTFAAILETLMSKLK
jgi:hypothetical protein